MTPRAGQGRDVPVHHRVDSVVAYMRGHLGDRLTLAEMAEAAGTSPFHFIRVFRSVTGLAPRGFLAALRLEEAKRLLVTTRLSVTDVCYEVGYDSLGTFSARFTRLVGVPPGEFQRSGRRVAEDCARLVEKARLDGLQPCPRPAGHGFWIAGRIEAPGAPPGVVFAGLFPRSAPLGVPPSCTVLPLGPGPYCLEVPAPGAFWVLACLVPWGVDPLGYLLAGKDTWVGGSPVQVGTYPRRRPAPVDVTLRPGRASDPPILASSAFTLARRPWILEGTAIEKKPAASPER